MQKKQTPGIILIIILAILAGISLFAKTPVNSILWFVSVISVLSTSLFLLSVLKITRPTVYIIGFTLFAYANVVITSLVSGIAGFLGHAWILVMIHLVILTVSYLLFKKLKNPLLPTWIHRYDHRDHFIKLRLIWKKDPAIIWLIAATGICYLIVSILILVVPSNVDDILTTYLPRAGYWLQQGSFNIWFASDYNLPQVVYPLNGQLPLAWLISLWGNDALAGFLQFLSIPMGAAGIYGLSKLLGASRKQGVFAALLFFGLPEIVILSSTALTDLLVANFTVVIVYLLLLGIQENERKLLGLSGLALGIALGIKQTVFFLLPGLALLALILFLQKGKKVFKPLVLWVSFSLLAFLLVGSFMYLHNIHFFGKPLGPNQLTMYFTNTEGKTTVAQYLSNGLRSFSNLILLSLFDNLPSTIMNRLDVFFSQIAPLRKFMGDILIGNLYGSSKAWSGQIGFILLVVTFFYSLVHSIKQKKWVLLGLVLIVLSYTVILMTIRNFTTASTRYLESVVILLIPMAFLVTRKKWVRTLLVINSVVMMTVTLLFDGAKPLVGTNAIWGKTQNELRNLVLIDDFLPSFDALDKYLPADATIGFILPKKFPQSYLFGKDYTRRVIQYDPQDNTISLDELLNRDVEYLLVDTDLINEGFNLPELTLIRSDPQLVFTIFQVPAQESGGVQ